MEAVKSRRQEYTRQTRAALLDAAADAFAGEGFADTSLTQIAAAAGVTKGAVYHHFRDKQDLFDALICQYNDAAQRRVHEAVESCSEGIWGAAMAGLQATLDICADPVAGRLIYLEGPIGLGWKRWREYEREYTHKNVRRLLSGAINAGILSDDISDDAMTEVLAGMITHAGIALAEAHECQRNSIRRGLEGSIRRVLLGLRSSAPSATRPSRSSKRANRP